MSGDVENPLQAADRLVQRGLAKFYATAGSQATARERTPAELAEMGAQLTTPDREAMLTVKGPSREKPLKEKYPDARIDAPETGQPQQETQPSADVLVDVSGVATQNKIDGLGMQLVLGEQAQGQVEQANAAFDRIRDAQASLRRRQERTASLLQEQETITASIADIKRRFEQAVKDGEIPEALHQEFNAIKTTLQPRLEALQTDLQRGTARLTHLREHLERLTAIHREPASVDDLALDRLGEDVVAQTVRAGNIDRPRVRRPPRPEQLPQTERAPVPEKLGLLAEAVGRETLDEGIFDRLTQAFPGIALVGNDKKLIPAGVQQALDFLTTERIGEAVHAQTKPFAEFAAAVPRDERESFWQELLPKARKAIRALKERLLPQQHASSLELWTSDERNLLLYGRTDGPDWDTGRILILTAGGTGKTGVPPWEAARDTIFTGFDRLSLNEKQALPERWDEPPPGREGPWYRFPAGELCGGLIDMASYAPTIDTSAIDNRTKLSLVDVPIAIDRGIVHTKQFTEPDFTRDVKQTLTHLATAIAPIDSALSAAISRVNGTVRDGAQPSEVIAALRTFSDADRGRINDFVYASLLVRNMKEHYRSEGKAFAFRPVDLKLDETREPSEGVTITARNWRSPVLSTMMHQKDIVPVGTAEQPFTLTIKPDARIVITGPNANGKTVFAKMMTAAIMGYPVVGSLTITGNPRAFEALRRGVIPHFQEPKIAGLSTFQRVATGLRRALTEGFPVMDETVQGTTSDYARRINAGSLVLTPQMTVLHGAGETLSAALRADPTLKNSIIPITVEGFAPTIGSVAVTSGGLELAQHCVPPIDFLDVLRQEALLAKREIAPSPEIDAVSAYVSEHARELGEGRADAELLAELGLHSDEGGIIWFKGLLTRLALVEKSVPPETIGLAESLLDGHTEQKLLLRALTETGGDRASHRSRVTEWFMRKQGGSLPDIVTRWVDKLPHEVRGPVQRYLNIDTARQPYQDTTHMALLLAMRQGNWPVARQFLASDTAHELSRDAQTTFAALLPQHSRIIPVINEVSDACEALRQESLLDALSSVGRAAINVEIATRTDTLIAKAQSNGFTDDAKAMIDWLQTSKYEEERLLGELDQKRAPLGTLLAEAMVKDFPIEGAAPELIRDAAAILFYNRADEAGYQHHFGPRDIIHQHSLLRLLRGEGERRYEDQDTAAALNRWSAFIAKHAPKQRYTFLPHGYEATSPDWPWAKKLNAKQKTALAERMAMVIHDRFFDVLGGSMDRDDYETTFGTTLELASTRVKYAFEPLREVRGTLQEFQIKRENAQRLEMLLTALASDPQGEGIMRLLNDNKHLLRTPWFDDYKFYSELRRAASPELTIAQKVTTITEKQGATLQDYCQSLKGDAFRQHRTLEDLVSTLVSRRARTGAREAFGEERLTDTQADLLFDDVREILSLAGYGRLYQAMGTSAVAQHADTLRLDGLVNIETIATTASLDQRVRRLASAEEIRAALADAVGGYRKARSVAVTPAVTHFVTGPNGSGKSTLVAAVGQASVLSRHTGRVPAASGAVPGFARILLVKGGETTAAMSKFTASLQAITRMLRTIQAHPDEPMLVVMDEIGTGTNPDEAKVLRRAVARVLANYPKVTVVTVDQEADAWQRLNALGKPTAIMALTDEHEVRPATEFVDPGSIGVLTAPTIGGQTPPPMPTDVQTVFKELK